MKKIINVLRRIIISAFLLYGYNIIAVNFNLTIPINFITILGVFLLGSSGLCGLILFRYIFL